MSILQKRVAGFCQVHSTDSCTMWFKPWTRRWSSYHLCSATGSILVELRQQFVIASSREATPTQSTSQNIIFVFVVAVSASKLRTCQGRRDPMDWMQVLTCDTCKRWGVTLNEHHQSSREKMERIGKWMNVVMKAQSSFMRSKGHRRDASILQRWVASYCLFDIQSFWNTGVSARNRSTLQQRVLWLGDLENNRGRDAVYFTSKHLLAWKDNSLTGILQHRRRTHAVMSPCSSWSRHRLRERHAEDAQEEVLNSTGLQNTSVLCDTAMFTRAHYKNMMSGNFACDRDNVTVAEDNFSGCIEQSNAKQPAERSLIKGRTTALGNHTLWRIQIIGQTPTMWLKSERSLVWSRVHSTICTSSSTAVTQKAGDRRLHEGHRGRLGVRCMWIFHSSRRRCVPIGRKSNKLTPTSEHYGNEAIQEHGEILQNFGYARDQNPNTSWRIPASFEKGVIDLKAKEKEKLCRATTEEIRENQKQECHSHERIRPLWLGPFVSPKHRKWCVREDYVIEADRILPGAA